MNCCQLVMVGRTQGFKSDMIICVPNNDLKVGRSLKLCETLKNLSETPIVGETSKALKVGWATPQHFIPIHVLNIIQKIFCFL